MATMNAINNIEIPDTLIDAKGDLIGGTAADTPGKLTVGANDTILVAASGETTGLKWATVASLNAVMDVDFNAKGDLLSASADDTPLILAVGATDGMILMVDSGEASGLKYTTATYPSTVTSGNILYASGANVVGNDTAANLGLMEKSIVNAKGDIISASADNTPLILGVGTNGQVLTAASGEATGLIWAANESMTWAVVTEDTQMVVNNAYITNDGVDLCTVTLPDTAAVGTRIIVVGMNANGWQIAQNALETIHFGTLSSTVGVGGYIASTNTRDAVELVCVVADTDWCVTNAVGNITIA